MVDITQEISTDYDLDYVEPEEGDPLKILDQEAIECEALSDELASLMDATLAIESFGITPTAHEVMKRSGLLAGTSLEVLGMEHFAQCGPDAAETHMAVESLVDKVKEKMAAWSAKVIGFVKQSSVKVLDILTGLKDKIFEQGKVLAGSVWDTAKSAGHTIKAHPFRTLVAVVAAIVVVAGIVALCAAPGSYANETALRSFMYKVQDAINKIKWPFGSLKAGVVENAVAGTTSKTLKLTCVVEKVGESAAAADTVNKLGWTQSAVKAILSQLGNAWSSVKSGVSAMSAPVIAVVKKVDAIGGDMKDKVGAKVTEKTGSKLAGWAANKWVERLYTTALWSIIGTVTKLLHAIVIKGFQAISDTFSKLKNEPQTA